MDLKVAKKHEERMKKPAQSAGLFEPKRVTIQLLTAFESWLFIFSLVRSDPITHLHLANIFIRKY
jgi:hypothetical protein